MIAYLFWHRPATGTETREYEERLAGFHTALADAPPPGLASSSTFRVEGAPWLAGDRGYEDWYLVEDWPAVGRLEEWAVSGARRGPHEDVARLAGDGAGGLYGSVIPSREAAADSFALWFGKPRGVAYASFHARLRSVAPRGGGIWQRKMVLGPAPEFCMTGDRVELDVATGEVGSSGTLVRRERIWP